MHHPPEIPPVNGYTFSISAIWTLATGKSCVQGEMPRRFLLPFQKCWDSKRGLKIKQGKSRNKETSSETEMATWKWHMFYIGENASSNGASSIPILVCEGVLGNTFLFEATTHMTGMPQETSFARSMSFPCIFKELYAAVCTLAALSRSSHTPRQREAS